MKHKTKIYERSFYDSVAGGRGNEEAIRECDWIFGHG